MIRRPRNSTIATGAALCLVLLAALPFTSCRKAAATGATLRVAIAAGPLTLDPRLATDAEGDKIASLICDGLFARDDALELVPAIAARSEQLSPTSYRITLRPNVTFHDGTPLSATDVAFTFRSMIDGSLASPFKAAYDCIDRIEVEGPLVLRFDLKEPYAPFLSQLTRGIVSQKAALAAGKSFARKPVCAGPYQLVRFEPDERVELAAYPGYYAGLPRTNGLVFIVVKDDNVRVLKLLRGDVDLVQNGIPPMLLADLLKNQPLREATGTGTVMTYLGMNLADPILAHPKVREAIAAAIDRDEVIAHRFQGMAEQANSILAPGNWAYDTELPQLPFDPARAKALLDEAGYPDPDGDGPRMRFQLVYKTSTVKERIEIAQMIAHQLGKVGIGVRVAPYEWGTFYRDIRSGNFQIYSLSWVGVFEPDIFYEVCDSGQTPPAGLNRGRYQNPAVDALVRAGRTEMDQAKRKKLYAEVQQILLKELPFVPLWYEKNVAISRAGVEGVRVRPDASYRVFMDVEVKSP